jgi:predicted dehydrogenase
VEKPFASSAEVTRRLLTSAEAHGLHACPVHQFPFQNGFRRVLGALGTLGRIRHVDVVVCSAGSDGRDASGRDEIALEIVPHALSLLARLLPEPVDEPAWRVDHPEAGELRATTVVGGATLSILVSMAGRPTRNTLRVVADRGTAHADLFHGFAVIEPGDVSRARKLARPFTLSATTLAAAATNLAGRALTRRPAYPGLRELIEAFHGSVRTGSPPPIAATETLRVARAWDAIRRSAGAPDPA